MSIIGYLSSPVDMNGQRVQYEDAAPPADKSAAIEQNGSDRFVVQSVGLDVPLGELNSVDGSIEPPGFTSAYRVRDMGVSPKEPDKGTVFVVMHSLRNGATGPGNYLIDVDKRAAKVQLGAKIDVDGNSYTVTGTQVIDKPEIAGASAIWSNTPGRLVVITCLQRPDGRPSTQNMVIEAQKDRP
ncbi:class F sortase [Plantibacter sp. VKM Ac-2885]|uniref:class F sortase n=1 Tax=Plantibacter sp. VKM Ac-2885 TaxID=2783828 RepID=UPI00188D2B98|nr:class F sortase [Plantibacter sp. VKM Ac-2885]MBF4514141.1 class F sortase [Plantibacter sp. VKM Ac-2885]